MGSLTVRGIAGITKPGRHSDGSNLYLNVTETGSKSWLVMWKRGGRRREMGIGPYPLIGLADARRKAADAMRAVYDGNDPIVLKRRPAAGTFGDVADRYINEKLTAREGSSHRRLWVRSLTEFSAPIRKLPIDSIGVDDIVGVVRPVWIDRPETGKKVRIHIAKVFDFAKALRLRAGPNPAAWEGNLKDILPEHSHVTQHRAALPYKDAPAFVQRLRSQDSMSALFAEFVVLTAVRISEARLATWSEIDFDSRIWTVPAPHAKQRREFDVPLSARAVEILRYLQKLGAEYCFPGGKKGKPLSTSVLDRLFERMEIEKGQVTAHGFRSTFRDWAGDCTDTPREVAEAALSHRVGNAAEQAYRRGDAFEKRRKLMQDWANYCGNIRCKSATEARKNIERSISVGA